MGRKKTNEIEQLTTNYNQALNEDVNFSLEIDPTNKYKFSEVEKEFLKAYIQLKNVEASCNLSGMELEPGMKFLLSYNAQSEIRRINLAICHHQFNSKMATLEEIGGYLTSLITGEYTPLTEQLTTKEKLEVSKIIVDINKLQQGAIENPSIILTKNIDMDLKNLSVSTIKNMLETSEKIDTTGVSEITLTPEEVANIKTQSKEYLELLNLVNKGGKNE